ncbi:MAG: LytTR family DNA-binding domain-containing protein [Chitinispirillales bacterium]|jgi:two-component system response regulator LytT|nr:LytTR family DNA-binding domain-containing protein [Chitinispirillales bacterium]
MKIFIVEDEKVAARRLVRQVEEILPDNELSLFYEFQEIITAIKIQPPDLLILDLNLNGDDGFNILKSIEEKKFETIVVSATGERALEGFDLDIVDFVLKPYDKERLQKALQKFIGRHIRRKGKKEILIKDGSSRIIVPIEQILYISGAGDYREIHCKDGKTYLHDNSLEKFGEILSGNFIRIHNSYLVDENSIAHTIVLGGGKYEAVLRNGEKLPVSRSRYKGLFGVNEQ